MQYGIELPNQGTYGNVHTLVELASLAEQTGWDGVFIWDCLLYGKNEATVCDPWIALTCIAEHTERLRFGALMTPLSRHRPWNVARQTVTLDHLSHGRLIMGASIGDLNDRGFTHVGEVTDARVRAEMLDEGLEVLMGLWSGQVFSYEGKYYQMQEMTFLSPPVQSPRIPIWVGGYWPNKRPMRRAARFDGICPGKVKSDGTPDELTPADVQNLKTYIASQRTTDTPFDIVIGGQTSGDDPEQAETLVTSFAKAGATWWLESAGAWPELLSLDTMRARIRQGPPRIDTRSTLLWHAFRSSRGAHPQCINHPRASCRVIVRSACPIASCKASGVRAPTRRKKAFSGVKMPLQSVKNRGSRMGETEVGSSCFDGLPNLCSCMCAQIIHDHDLSCL